MRIGIICEGHTDRAVISNIITGITGLDYSDIVALRPSDTKDATDKALKETKKFSTWSVVKEECINRELIDDFLALEGQEFITLHIDTAEADEYGIKRPDKKTDTYCNDLRNLVIEEIKSWLQEDLDEKLLHAIAIEELEAWILPIYESKDSSSSANPKGKLDFILGKQKVSTVKTYATYLSISEALGKAKEIKQGKFLSYNDSLNDFFEEVRVKVLPKIEPDNQS